MNVLLKWLIGWIHPTRKVRLIDSESEHFVQERNPITGDLVYIDTRLEYTANGHVKRIVSSFTPTEKTLREDADTSGIPTTFFSSQ